MALTLIIKTFWLGSTVTGRGSSLTREMEAAVCLTRVTVAVGNIIASCQASNCLMFWERVCNVCNRMLLIFFSRNKGTNKTRVPLGIKNRTHIVYLEDSGFRILSLVNKFVTTHQNSERGFTLKNGLKPPIRHFLRNSSWILTSFFPPIKNLSVLNFTNTKKCKQYTML